MEDYELKKATVQDYAREYSLLWEEYKENIEKLTNKLLKVSDQLSKTKFPDKDIFFDFEVDSSIYDKESDETELYTMIGPMYVKGDVSYLKDLKVMLYSEKEDKE